MNAVLATRPEPLDEQALLDLARLSRLENAARRARQYREFGHTADFWRAVREAQETIHELTGWTP